METTYIGVMKFSLLVIVVVLSHCVVLCCIVLYYIVWYGMVLYCHSDMPVPLLSTRAAEVYAEVISLSDMPFLCNHH